MRHFILKCSTALALFALIACSGNTFENTGEAVDQAITDAGNAVEDACENVKEELDTNDQDC